MRSSSWARAASRPFSRSSIPCRWVCEPAAANSGARATSDWLSSESRDAASRLGRLVLATWLKAVPKRAKARSATPLPRSQASVAAAVPRAVRRRNCRLAGIELIFPRSLNRAALANRNLDLWSTALSELGQQGVLRKLVAFEFRVSGLAEPREVDLAPLRISDLGETPRHRQVDGAHRDLQADVLLSEVATVVIVAQNDHGPGAEQKMTAVGHYHLTVDHLLHRDLAPIQASDQHVLAGLVTRFAQRRDRAERHRIVGRPQRIDVRPRRDELAHRRLRGLRSPVQVTYFYQFDRARPERFGHVANGALQPADALVTGRGLAIAGEGEDFERTGRLDPRCLGQDGRRDPISGSFVIGHDAAEPAAVFRAGLAEFSPVFLVQFVVQQDQLYMRSVGNPDDFRSRVDIIGCDKVVQGRVLGNKLLGELDRLVARASGLANIDVDPKLRRRCQHRCVDRVPEFGWSRWIDEPDPEISAPRRGRRRQQEDNRRESPHRLKQDALLS